MFVVHIWPAVPTRHLHSKMHIKLHLHFFFFFPFEPFTRKTEVNVGV